MWAEPRRMIWNRTGTAATATSKATNCRTNRQRPGGAWRTQSPGFMILFTKPLSFEHYPTDYNRYDAGMFQQIPKNVGETDDFPTFPKNLPPTTDILDDQTLQATGSTGRMGLVGDCFSAAHRSPSSSSFSLPASHAPLSSMQFPPSRFSAGSGHCDPRPPNLGQTDYYRTDWKYQSTG